MKAHTALFEGEGCIYLIAKFWTLKPKLRRIEIQREPVLSFFLQKIIRLPSWCHIDSHASPWATFQHFDSTARQSPGARNDQPRHPDRWHIWSAASYLDVPAVRAAKTSFQISEWIHLWWRIRAGATESTEVVHPNPVAGIAGNNTECGSVRFIWNKCPYTAMITPYHHRRWVYHRRRWVAYFRIFDMFGTVSK